MTAALSSHFLKQAEDTTSLKSTVSPACAHKDLLHQGHSAGAAFLDYLYCFILTKNRFTPLWMQGLSAKPAKKQWILLLA